MTTQSEKTKEMISTALSGLIGKRMGKTDYSTDMVRGIINTLLGMNIGVKIVEEAIQFESFAGDPTELIPANLYTLLITRGVVVDYELVKDKTEYKVPENVLYYAGSTICFERGSDKFILKPNKPLKKILLNVIVNKEL